MSRQGTAPWLILAPALFGVTCLLCAGFSHTTSWALIIGGFSGLCCSWWLLRGEQRHHLEVIRLQRARRVAELKLRLERQREALVQFHGPTDAYCKNLEEQVQAVLVRARETLGCQAISCWLLQSQNHFIVYTAPTTSPGAPRKEHAAFDPGLNLLNRISGVRSQTLRLGAASALFGFSEEQHALFAPIIDRGSPAGFLCAWDKNVNRFWRLDEQEFLASIADHISRFLDYERTENLNRELATKSAAIEQATVGIAILDTNRTVRYCNGAFAQTFLLPRTADACHQDLCSLYMKAGAELTCSLNLEQLASPEMQPLVVSGRRADRSPFQHEILFNTLREGGSICVLHDVTQRMVAEIKLQETQDFLRSVIDTDPNLIFVKNRDGKFTMVNRATAEIYGTTVEGLVGRSDADFNPKTEEVAHFLADDQAVIDRHEERFIPEEEITDFSGRKRYLQTVKRPLTIRSSGETFVLGVASDISEHRRLHEQLLQSQKMEALGQLAGGIAHDFNNMLTAILGYTAMLREPKSSARDTLHCADLIEKAALRSAQLTQKLLGFARKGKHQHTRVDLHGVVHDTLTIVSRAIEPNITLRLQLRAEQFAIEGDPTQMQQVILNLVLNARDAVIARHGTHGKGWIEIRTRVRVNQTGEACGIELTLADNGTGMSEELQQRIFEPFFTTKSPGKGTGMGLPMVYGIVKNHGGSLNVESVPGQGSTFSVALPLMPTLGPPAKSQDSDDVLVLSAQRSPQEPGQILVVDDHQEVRDTTAHMLHSLGYEVLTASDGLEAVSLFKDSWKSVQLVILDMVMPRMGARDCFRVLKSINPGIRVILSTGYVDNNSVQEILQEGIVGFVQKPYRLERLSEVVLRALRC